MLLGGDAGERLEPVRVVGRAMLERPVLDGHRDGIGHRHVQGLAAVDRAPEGLVDGPGQFDPLYGVAEDEPAEVIGGAGRGPGGPAS